MKNIIYEEKYKMTPTNEPNSGCTLNNNSLLSQARSMDVVIGIKNGVPQMMKNRYGEMNKQISIAECINILVRCLTLRTDIDFFDEAAKQELIDVMCNVIDKHAVRKDITVSDILRSKIEAEVNA